VSVHPAAAGRGLGRALIEAAAEQARARGEDRVTLTTFADVPWNAPYYQRLGFVVVLEDEQGPELRRIRAHEAEIGLDRWPRVAMARRLGTNGHQLP
jgi:predicted N-acetyltransferase YhbS